MKIKISQLRKIIEASVIRRSDDYVAPIEAPLEDPRKFDFDLSDENKGKLLDLAASADDKTRAQADNLADTIGLPSSGRFGADTLSKQMRMYDVGLDLINDPEIDQIINRGVERYFNDRRRDSFAIDLADILESGYKYPPGPGGFQLYLEGDPNWREKMPAGFDSNQEFFDMTVEEPHLHIDIVHAIMDEIRFLIKIKFEYAQGDVNMRLTKDFFEPEDLKNTRVENDEQRIAKLKKAYNLFKRRSQEERINFGPAIVQHIYDKAMQPMYEIFTSAIQKFNPSQDMSQVKEGKLKITRMQLRKLIETSVRKRDDGHQEYNPMIDISQTKKGRR